MRIRVLGSAAGGGFPQWNCGCANCRAARESARAARSRTQECVAVSGDGDAWFLLNASPEIRTQIESFASLHPRAPRHSPIAAVVLTSGDLDHCLGLLSLRESQPLVVYATETVRRGFCETNALYRTLERVPGQVTWRALELDGEVELVGAGGKSSRLRLTAVPVRGKPPIHLEGVVAPSAEDNVGLVIREPASGRRLAYFSGAGAIDDRVLGALERADCLFFDGTFWSETELLDQGLGTKRAADMAHLPVGGRGGSLERLAGVAVGRRIFIHLNNTNPMLRDDSPEATAVRLAGWEIAEDGMEIEL